MQFNYGENKMYNPFKKHPKQTLAAAAVIGAAAFVFAPAIAAPVAFYAAAAVAVTVTAFAIVKMFGAIKSVFASRTVSSHNGEKSSSHTAANDDGQELHEIKNDVSPALRAVSPPATPKTSRPATPIADANANANVANEAAPVDAPTAIADANAEEAVLPSMSV